MTKEEESKIRRDGFPINSKDSIHLLSFIDLFDKEHKFIEPDIIVKLEFLSGKFYLEEIKK